MAPKRRRNKHKKTSVHQATGDRVAFDKWNWRKYGEKLIKGSPYPRSYYRCSSNAGGCLARKQVEQSCTDPRKFLITYIDDHTHPYPSHRPSQAGRTSRRFHASSLDISTSNTTNTTGTTSAPIRAKDTVHVHYWDNDFDELFAGLEGLEMDVICDTSLFSDQYRCPSNVA
ncbi:WRKY transcription factor 22-like [Silene latifolia]|uniref:WRKY transcription factor 22-like n=1 Tax=Silene latifolia TaxID=37657 RepID=UPI003D7893F5